MSKKTPPSSKGEKTTWRGPTILNALFLYQVEEIVAQLGVEVKFFFRQEIQKVADREGGFGAVRGRLGRGLEVAG